MSALEAGIACFIIGFFVGFILAAIMVAARDESRGILGCPKPKACKHKNIIEYHDNSILCTDCHEVIWQGKCYGEPYPVELQNNLPGGMYWNAYKEGRYACRDCMGPNPYPEYSDEWRMWNRGWNDQLEGRKPE